MRIVVRMSTNNPLSSTLGEVVAEAMSKAKVSENQASLRTGISRQTLRRRLAAGGFKDFELYALATILNTRPSRLWARAEERAA